jgi:hypothetical protein
MSDRGWLRGMLIAGAITGCGDYLTGPGVSTDPNAVTTIDRPGPLYHSIQSQAGRLGVSIGSREAAVQYTQQLAGLGRGAAQVDAYRFITREGFVYGGGGLLDIRKVQQLARRSGDSLYLGIAKVYEAIRMGEAAAVFGDTPYREAADSSNPRPRYDPQLQIYADLQQQLDSAIHVFLAAAGLTNAGPAGDGQELVYRGRDAAGLRAVYAAVARSLKARFFMHVATASRAGVSGAPPAAYDSALAYATDGIRSTADDMLWFYDIAVGETNPWWAPPAWDIGPGAALIEIMKRRIAEGVEDSLRLAFYFVPASDGEYRGYRPSGSLVAAAPGIADGSGPYSDRGDFINQFVSDGSFRLPEISYAETQLIAAEAAWQLGCPGCAPTEVVGAAQPFLDNARRGRRYGATSEGPVLFGDAPGGLPASLKNIIEEKYVTLFLNPEVWNDWKRTCLPSLAPALGAPGIPGRLPYSDQEATANPNTPTISSTGVPITAVSRNPNQPDACPALNYVDSTPLAN